MEQQTGIELASLYLWKPSFTLDVWTQHCNGPTGHTGDPRGQPATSSPHNPFSLSQLFPNTRPFLLIFVINDFSFSKCTIADWERV